MLLSPLKRLSPLGGLVSTNFPSTLTDGTCSMRQVIRGDYLCTDVTLTATGFAGAESTDGGITGDWMCVESVPSLWTPLKDRSLFYSSRSGLDLLETGSGSSINAKIIPSSSQINSTNYLLKTVSVGATDTEGFVEAELIVNDANKLYVFTSDDPARTTRYFELFMDIGYAFIRVRESTSPLFNNTIRTTATISNGLHTIRWSGAGAGTGAYTITVDGTSVALTTVAGANNGYWIGSVAAAQRTNMAIGCAKTTGLATSTNTNYLLSVNYNNVYKWNLSGAGLYEFDTIGVNHLTWTGTDHIAYNINGLTTLMDSGFSVWTKVGSANEYVPYKSGSPYDIGAFLAGYSKKSDNPGGVAIFNYAPSLVDFDYLDTADALLVAFDKSNATHHIATAGMSYFDAANVYRWRNDELESPQKYSDTYKNVGYKAFWLIKGLVVSEVVVNMSELLLYTKDQTGINEWKFAQYCTLQDLVVQSGGQPVYDGDNYLTWI